jgi:hypothetical protein
MVAEGSAARCGAYRERHRRARLARPHGRELHGAAAAGRPSAPRGAAIRVDRGVRSGCSRERVEALQLARLPVGSRPLRRLCRASFVAGCACRSDERLRLLSRRSSARGLRLALRRFRAVSQCAQTRMGCVGVGVRARYAARRRADGSRRALSVARPVVGVDGLGRQPRRARGSAVLAGAPSSGTRRHAEIDRAGLPISPADPAAPGSARRAASCPCRLP